jgi:hypothetical protein
VVGHLVDDVKLLDGELVDLVQHVDAGDVASIALDHVDQLVDGGVAAAEDVSAHDLVLPADHEYDLVREDGLRHHGLEVDGALLLAPATDRQTDTHTHTHREREKERENN